LLITAFYAFITFYDFNKFKPIIARAIKDVTGRELTIAGNIGLRLGVRPTLKVAEVSLQNAPWSSSPNSVRLKQMEVQIAVLPLITGNLEFIRLVLIEPEVIVEFNSADTSNFAFETADEKSDKKKGPEETPKPPLIFSNVHIENGHFTYKDATSGFTFAVRIDRLDGAIPGFDKSLQLDFEGAYNDIPLNVKGTLGPIWAWVMPGYTLPADLTVEAGGATANVKGELRDPFNLENLAFNITAAGPSIPDVAKLAGVNEVPELGAFKLTATVADLEGKLAAEGLDLRIGSEDLAEIIITGGVKDLLDLEGINLNVKARGKDSAKLAKLGIPALPRQSAYHLSASIAEVEPRVFAANDLKLVLAENEVSGQMQLSLAQQIPLLTANLTSQKFELGPFNLDLKLSGPLDKPAIKEIDLQLGTPELAKIHLNGSVADLKKLDGVDLNFEAHGNNLSNLEQLTKQPLPVRGAFSASGKVLIPVHKNLKIPKLKISIGKTIIMGSLDLDLRNQKPRLSANLSSSKVDLANVLSPELAKLPWVKGLAKLRPVKLTAKLAGFAKDFAAERVDLRLGTYKSAEFRLTGSIKNVPAQRGVKLNLSVRGQEYETLTKLFGQSYFFAPIPARGAYSISGKVHDREAKVFRVSNFEYNLDKIEAKGWLDLNLAGPWPQIEVELSTRKFNPQVLPLPDSGMLANLRKIADLGPLKFTSRLNIKEGQISLQQLDLQGGTDQLVAVKAKGAIQNLTVQSGIDLHVVIQGNEVANLEKIIGHTLPLKGAYAISGTLTDPKANNYKVNDLALKLGENNLTGWLELNLSGKQMAFSTELAAPQFTLQPVTIPTLENLGRIEDLGPLKIGARLVGSAKKFALENLDLNMGSEKMIAVMIKGDIKDLSAVNGLNLEFVVRGNDLASFEKLGGPILPFQGPFDLTGQFTGPAPKIYRTSSLKAHFGKNDVSGWIELNLSKERPLVRVELSSQELDLRPLLAKEEKENKATPSAPKDGKIFPSEPLNLDALKAIDATLKVQNKYVLLPKIALNDVIFDVLLDNGHLLVKPFTFIIGGGHADNQFELKLQDTPPTMTLVNVVEDLDLGLVYDELGYPRTFEGKLNVDIRLSGRGASVAELMAGLNGEMYSTMNNGRMDSRYLDMLQKYFGSDVLQLLNPFKSQEQYSRINCSVNHIGIKNGLAEVKLLLDNEQTSILAAGDINLKTEALDLGIKPTPKKGFGLKDIGGVSFSFKQLSQPFQLGGTLAKPELVLDPSRSAFTLGKFTGALALVPFVGPLGLAAFFADVSVGKQDACAKAMQLIQKKEQAAIGTDTDKTPGKTDPHSNKVTK
jgi:uncharacterized protein involved in outer membrane biogenesis